MSVYADTFVRDNLPPRDQWAEMTFSLPELKFPAQYNASSHQNSKPHHAE